MTRFPVRIVSTVSMLISTATFAWSQLDCRSMMGAYIAPLSDSSRLSWGAEITVAPGILRDRSIFNTMGLAGVDYTSFNKKHNVYFEGAVKYWYNSVTGPGLDGSGEDFSDFSKPAKNHFGFRELYYRYNDFLQIKTGIQSLKSPDFFLIDERLLGISAQKQTGNLRFDLQTGTVFSGIARMSDVCGVRHLYNLAKGAKISFVGVDPFDSNFALASATWVPGRHGKKSMVSNDQEAPGEFEEFSLSENTGESANGINKGMQPSIEKTGILFYEEFGSRFHDYKYHGAAFIHFHLLPGTDIKLELLYQHARNTRAWITYASIGKEFQWKNGGITELEGKWYHLIRQDEKVLYFPAFTNLFLGEMMRLDAMHFPLLTFSAGHKFPGSNKLQVDLNYVRQLKDQKTSEVDLITGIKVHRNARLSAIFGYVSSGFLIKDNYLTRLELRIAF